MHLTPRVSRVYMNILPTMDTSSPDLVAGSSDSFLDGFIVGKVPSALTFADPENKCGLHVVKLKVGVHPRVGLPNRCSVACRNEHRFARRNLIWAELLQDRCTVASVSAELFRGERKRRLSVGLDFQHHMTGLRVSSLKTLWLHIYRHFFLLGNHLFDDSSFIGHNCTSSYTRRHVSPPAQD
jgi:hypothetical protein